MPDFSTPLSNESTTCRLAIVAKCSLTGAVDYGDTAGLATESWGLSPGHCADLFHDRRITAAGVRKVVSKQAADNEVQGCLLPEGTDYYVFSKSKPEREESRKRMDQWTFKVHGHHGWKNWVYMYWGWTHLRWICPISEQ